MHRITPVLAALAALMLPACGPGESAEAPKPGTQEIQQARRADAAGDAAAQAMKAANDAVVDDGSNGASLQTSQPAGSAAQPLAAAVAFNYSAAVNVTIDLDALDLSGNDRYPNATGQLNVAAAGTVNGTNLAGNAVYAVQTNWLTDGVFTDPVSGCTATMSAGSGFQYVLTLSWNWIAADHWTVSATSDLSGQHTVTVEHAGQTWTAACQGERHAGAVFSRTPAGFAAAFAVTAHRVIVVSGPDGTHTTVFAIAGLGAVAVTVDGTVYGPYSAFVAGVLFGCSID